MEDTGDTKEDLKLPDNDIGAEVQAKFDKDESFLVTVLNACNEEQIVGTKVLN